MSATDVSRIFASCPLFGFCHGSVQYGHQHKVQCPLACVQKHYVLPRASLGVGATEMSRAHTGTHARALACYAVLSDATCRQDSASVLRTFSTTYLFRHTAGLFIAILVCAFAEDQRYGSPRRQLRPPSPLSLLMASPPPNIPESSPPALPPDLPLPLFPLRCLLVRDGPAVCNHPEGQIARGGWKGTFERGES
jgi:hypothetical protein